MRSRMDESGRSGSGARGAFAVAAAGALWAIALGACAARGLDYPQTPRVAVADSLHGRVLIDEYRWLEDGNDPRVAAWTAAQVELTRSVLDTLPQRAWLARRFNELWRYDDESVPERALEGERLFHWAKRASDEKWTFNTRASDTASAVVLLNPNEWEATETLSGVSPSRDGRYVAFGRARGGDETPVVRVMDVASGALLPDTLRGWKQYAGCWLPDHSGFYYEAKPAPGTVPAGEEHYWHAVYLHRLGTPGAQDRRVFGDDEVKEHYHGVEMSEDGRYLVYYRWRFSRNEVYFQQRGASGAPIPLATGFDGQYAVTFAGERILIHTDFREPLGEVFVTDAEHLARDDWRVFLPADPPRKLSWVSAIAGRIYAAYEENATTRVRIHDLEGRHLRDVPFPPRGSGWVAGQFGRDETWASYSSFTHPPTSFRYDFARDSLIVHRAFPLDLDVAMLADDQLWYRSADGTPISMFLVHPVGLPRDGRNPVLLTGYGGFDVSLRPHFSTTYYAWLEAGGSIAIPNLRGGGEYGRAWHEAGMREKKQNVFDDMIAAAEHLIAEGYTSPDRLAISGGSNGGLLVGAVATQRPELFRAVDCDVPLLDMIRYHKFGLANIWAEEYGSSDDAQQFAYLLEYSPYHNVRAGASYPAMLVTGSENDARVDPLHARKMIARLQAADPRGRPLLLLELRDSGHGGGTTLAALIAQAADSWAFLMHELGIGTPR